MTPLDRLERRLPDQLRELAAERTPDYLDDLFARTAHTRQRPAWTHPERWFPMTVTLRRPMLAPPMRAMAMGLMLLLALVTALGTWAVLSTPRPAPTLPGVIDLSGVRNGLVAFAKDGDIHVAEASVTGVATPLITGPELDDWPSWSPDGRSILWERSVGEQRTLMIAAADGSDPRPLGEPYAEAQWTAWSHDGRSIALVTLERGLPVLWLVDVESGDAGQVDLGVQADWPAWLPDGSGLVVRGLNSGGAGVYRTIDWDAGQSRGSGRWPDGQAFSVRLIARGLTTIPDESTAASDDFRELAVSPDGKLIQWLNAMDNGDGRTGIFGGTDSRVFVMNINGTGARMLEVDPTSDYEDGAWFSPDGTRVSIIVRKGGDHQVGIVTLDGSRPTVTTSWRADGNAMPAVWSPDGKWLLSVRIEDGVSRLIDPDTGVETDLPWLGGWPSWQPIVP